MRNIFVTLLLLVCSFISYGQTVTAPDSKSFLQSTSGQDASGFVLSGFNATDVLFASISLVSPPTGTTFTVSTTTGLTYSSGYTTWSNITRISFTGTESDINNALASLTINTSTTKGNVVISVAACVNPTGYYFNGVNGHFYKPVTTGTTYTNARASSLLTTFKGQTGYLVTITSSQEDLFIQANVPQTNIWFAATDEVRDGTWVIDAGPEKGTIMKTANGATAGNIAGVYNNWANGEPNGGNHSEDYAVTKWNGNKWNDLSNNWANPYVIEYGTWSNPDDQTFTDFFSNSVSNTNGDVLAVKFNFNFGGNVDETKFSSKAYTYVNSAWNTAATSQTRTLSGLGKVDISNDVDTAKVNSGGYKATITDGNVEWSYCEPNSFGNGYSRLLIDMRQFTTETPSSVSSVNLMGIYNGSVEYLTSDPNGWAEYRVPSDLVGVTTSTNASIRNAGYGGWAFACSVAFGVSNVYKQHGIELTANNQTELNTLYNSIVTVSDVYLAFKELANIGILGNESGNEFTSGIQYMNADVDENDVFNEADCFKLLQHLTGVQSIAQSTSLTYLMKLIDKTQYDAVTKSNWNIARTGTDFSNFTRNLYPFSLNTGALNNTYNINVTWKGDVNLSHSALQTGATTVSGNTFNRPLLKSANVLNQIQSVIVTELSDGKVYAYINVDPLQQEVVGTQFQLNYDNTVLKFEKVDFTTNGNPTNYGTNRGDYVNVGSLVSDGSTTLDNTTEYKITFTPIKTITNTLGLISIGTTDAVSKSGLQLNVKVN